MTDQEFQDLMRLTPDATAPAQRARHAALNRLDQQPSEPAYRWKWIAAAALIPASFSLAMVLIKPAVKPPAPIAPEPAKTRMELKLSDGMRVQWTFSEDFEF